MIELTKTSYVHGLQCAKRLWYQVHQPELATAPTPAAERTMRQGTELGELARAFFPDGLLIEEEDRDAPGSTLEAIEQGIHTLYEAAFAVDDAFVRCDIINRQPDGAWEIIEVKMSTKVKDHYLPDLAIQRYATEQAGLDVSAMKLMYINSHSGRYPDLSDLFVIQEVTDRVTPHLDMLRTNVARLQGDLEQTSPPNQFIGVHCRQPHVCPFMDQCWRDIPVDSIFTIPRLPAKVKDSLIADGIVSIHDLPDDAPLSPKHWQHVEDRRAERVKIDRKGIGAELEGLDYPLYFLDFETDARPVPVYHGSGPFQQIPFQFSCHILDGNGSLQHQEYLHVEESDPRRPLAEALVKTIGPIGSIIAYNAAFESKVLRELATKFPDLSEPLIQFADRLWDQLKLMRKHYFSYQFRGSYSINSVLPVLVPSLSYGALNVRNGDEARTQWARLQELTSEAERAALIEDLLAYCKLDTLAMVEIHHHLTDVCRSESTQNNEGPIMEGETQIAG